MSGKLFIAYSLFMCFFFMVKDTNFSSFADYIRMFFIFLGFWFAIVFPMKFTSKWYIWIITVVLLTIISIPLLEQYNIVIMYPISIIIAILAGGLIMEKPRDGSRLDNISGLYLETKYFFWGPSATAKKIYADLERPFINARPTDGANVFYTLSMHKESILKMCSLESGDEKHLYLYAYDIVFNSAAEYYFNLFSRPNSLDLFKALEEYLNLCENKHFISSAEKEKFLKQHEKILSTPLE